MSVQAIGWVLDHSQAQGVTRCVLMSIANHVGVDGEGWAYVKQIMLEANCSLDSYKRSIQWAIANGELERDVNCGAAPKASANRKPNHFRLILTGAESPPLDLPPASAPPQSPQATPPQDAPPEPSLSLEPYKEPSISRASEFDEFWRVYPSKKAKGAARRAWGKATKTTDPRALVVAAASYAECREGKDPRYTAHPATWLNQERWLDEPDPVSVPERYAALARMARTGT